MWKWKKKERWNFTPPTPLRKLWTKRLKWKIKERNVWKSKSRFIMGDQWRRKKYLKEERGNLAITILKILKVQGHFGMFCSYEITFYCWTAAFHGMKISCWVKKLLRSEGRPSHIFSVQIYRGIYPKFDVFGPYFSIFWPFMF